MMSSNGRVKGYRVGRQFHPQSFRWKPGAVPNAFWLAWLRRLSLLWSDKESGPKSRWTRAWVTKDL
jgi:hypothetical protein